MKSFFIFFLTIISTLLTMRAQMLSPDNVSAGFGTFLPTYPQQFYDYWKNGYGITVRAAYGKETSIEKALTLDFGYFPFDKVRFNKKLGIDMEQADIDGGATSMFSLSGDLRYLIPGYENVLPYAFIGAGVMYSRVSEVTVNYVFAPAVQESRGMFAGFIPVGAYLEYPYSDVLILFLEAKHTYKIVGSKESHSNITVFCLGVVFNLQGVE